MGKLQAFLAARKEIAFDYEREVRAVADLLKGLRTIAGSEHLLQLDQTDGYVSAGQARTICRLKLQESVREVLLDYARNLCLEGIELGLQASMFEDALKIGLPAVAVPARPQLSPAPASCSSADAVDQPALIAAA